MIRERWLAVAVASCALLAALPTQAQDGRAILARSFTPTRSSFVGEQVTEITRPDGQKSRLQQRVFRDGNQLRINYPNGQVMYDDGERQLLYSPRPNVVEQGPSRLSAERLKLQRGTLALKRRLTVEQSGDDVVAGRSAHVLTVKDSLGKIPSRKLWIDRETFVQLRVEESPPRGGSVSTQFVSISYTDPPAGMLPFVVPAGARVVPRGQGRPIPDARAAQLARPWGGPLRPAYIPSGFQPSGFFLHRFKGQEVLVAVYRNPGTDQNLSVFQGPLMGIGEFERMANRPRVRVLTGRRGRADVAVVAPLTEAELKRVMDSIPE